MTPEPKVVGCYLCNRPYGNEHGFPDLVLPDDVWSRISPTGDEGGMLCPSCICQRLHELGLKDVPFCFRSGPLANLDTPTAAVQAQREKDAGIARDYLGETADNTMARTMQRVMDDIAEAIEKP